MAYVTIDVLHTPRHRGSAIVRFLAKVHKLCGDDACWLWIPKSPQFRLSVHYRTRAKRAAYLLFIGPVPAGASVLTACTNQDCVRPDHLWLSTDGPQPLARRGRPAGRTHIALRYEERRAARRLAHDLYPVQTAPEPEPDRG